ncbi:unnamed protein product [Lupinus luteus]|uniref:Uncharacterized protein n=1 Tax=Lupinus luteus TaxID=3873 RepID=A0AAV1XPT1_LUPLU
MDVKNGEFEEEVEGAQSDGDLLDFGVVDNGHPLCLDEVIGVLDSSTEIGVDDSVSCNSMRMNKEAHLDNVGSIANVVDSISKRGRLPKKSKKEKRKQAMVDWNNFYINLGDVLLIRNSISGISHSHEIPVVVHNSLDIVPEVSQEDNRIIVRYDGALLEAKELWDIGNKIGICGNGNDEEIVQKLVEMEENDKSQFDNVRRIAPVCDVINLNYISGAWRTA